MQVLIPCLIFLAVENVQLVRNERLDAQEVLDPTQFKNAVAKELLKKKLSNLESARQQDSLATFLKKGGKPSGLRTAPKSNFHKDDDPSRKQAQMANTFISSSNLLFGTKSQPRKSCKTSGKQASKEVLDMGSLRQLSGYNEDRGEFAALKSPELRVLNNSLTAVIKKRSYPRKAVPDPISCYLSEPKKVTCMHKDIIYKIALPSSEVADDEIGRIVESIYRAVEGKTNGKSSLDEPLEGSTADQKASVEGQSEAVGNLGSSEDSLKKKRASDDYLKSIFLNNMMMANPKAALPNYNGNSPVFVPVLIPMSQPKLPAGYYPGLAIDPRLQIPVNLSAGVDTLNSPQAGRNGMFDNSYGQYMVPDALPLPEVNLKQRSQVNLTEEEEKRRNWLALMATNGLVPVDNKLIAQSLVQHPSREADGLTVEKDSLSNGNKLTVAETSAVLDKLLNKRHERDTYLTRQQLRTNPYSSEDTDVSRSFHSERRKLLTKVVQKLSDPGDFIAEEKKGCPCPCPTDMCATASRCTRKSTKCPPRCPLKLLFQLTSLPGTTKSTLSTVSCGVTPKSSMCPEGCQPIPSCSCETTTSKSCSTTSSCRDSDILSRVVSSGNKVIEEQPESRQNPPLIPVQPSHLNWLPYSPQLPQNKLPDQPHAMPINGENPQAPSEDRNDHFEMSNEPLDNPQPSREEHQLSPQTFEQYQNGFHNVQQPLGQSSNVEGSVHEVTNEPGVQPPNRHMELQSKPVPHADRTNLANRQNDFKTKKHRDSFFARLRSKFQKGLSQNGMDSKKGATDQGNQYNQTILTQNKGVLGTSIFRFSQKNQTAELVKNNSSQEQMSKINQTTAHQQQNEADQSQTLVNQTQPSTINNINITISSMQPQPAANGQLSGSNQTNQQQPSNRMFVQCPVIPSSTTQAASSNGQNGKICTVTKIWLCSQTSTNATVLPNSTCVNVTQTTCPSGPTTIETTTQQSTYQTPSSTTTNESCPILDSQRSMNSPVPQQNLTFASGKPISLEALYSNTQLPIQSPPPSPYGRPESPGISRETPGPKFQTPVTPPPAWNQWQYPMDRDTSQHPTDRNFNWQQPPSVPLPTQFVPKLPQQNQPEPMPPQAPRPQQPAWHQPYQSQSHLTWQQPHSQQIDPRWQAQIPKEVPNGHQPNFQSQFPLQGNAYYGQPIKDNINKPLEIEVKPNNDKKWMKSDKSVGSSKTRLGMRKPFLPNAIEQHIDRVRRYMWKKQSKTSNKNG